MIRFKNLKTLIMILSVMLAEKSFADSFFRDSRRGWFWYEQRQFYEEAPHQNDQQSLNANIEKENARDKLKIFQEEIEERKAQMIMYPSIENTRKFLEIQNELFQRASLVAKYGQLAVLSYSELNIAKEQPISQAALQIARKEQNAQDKEMLLKFSKQFKLLFFYSSKCVYCEKFSYVLENFSQKYGFKVASVTIDGKQLSNFPASYNKGLIDRFEIKGTPALFAYSEERGVAVPVANGFLAIDLLEKNALLVANEFLNHRKEK